MDFLIAITALLVFIAANVLALATLLSSSWQTTLPLVQRRHRLCRVALYSALAAVVVKYVVFSAFAPHSGPPLGAALASLLVTAILPLLARNKAARVLEGMEMRDLIAGRD